MNYVREAIEYLKSYNDLEESIKNMSDEIERLKTEIEGQAITITDIPSGKNPIPDDRVINNIFKRQQLEESKSKTINQIKKMDEILNSLPEDEKKVLRMWFIENKSRIEISKEMQYSEPHLYRIKNSGLRRLAIKLFGIKVIGL